MATYFRLGSRLELNWLRDRIIELPRANRWQALARAALRDDLYSLHRAADAGGARRPAAASADSEAAIEAWSQPQRRRRSSAASSMLADIKASRSYDTTTLPVALREVRNLIRGGRRSGAIRAPSRSRWRAEPGRDLGRPSGGRAT